MVTQYAQNIYALDDHTYNLHRDIQGLSKILFYKNLRSSGADPQIFDGGGRPRILTFFF